MDHAHKVRLFGDAACVLTPSRVDEACPMMCIEAMACGTPVVASTRGALPELVEPVEPGVSGYVADDPSALAAGVDAATQLNRAEIHARAVHRFDVHAVAARYVALYSALVESDRDAHCARRHRQTEQITPARGVSTSRRDGAMTAISR